VSPVFAVLTFVLSPFFLYRRWIEWWKTSGSREAILYPYIQAGEEIMGNVGFAQGAWHEYRSRQLQKRATSHESEV
jgi:hypothetical protein